ncbi:hypothetical protein AN618_03930 [Fervidicola ferrireducens]|uniref:Uncharacterized protein n=1 Tax=Fervidicola ferrireducens TaxID=520764 RepID=A0A140LCQ2_9FIRM|nr:hypothetical protein [Fervidicola ferrireducens]KXG78327.1 hypothetical protein AN618_03930 [Fervidicola ferrireducens]
MNDGNIIFSTYDPLDRQIILKSDTWSNHISKHSEATPDDIRLNIEKPVFILKNVKPVKDGSSELIVDETRQDYIGLFKNSQIQRLYIMKTIVEFTSENKGEVVTNYILRKASEIKLIGGVIYDMYKSKNS